MSTRPRRGIFFDLDGTLLDTAPEFLVTINELRAQDGLPPMSMEALKPFISNGAQGMVEAAYPDLHEAGWDAKRQAFLHIYRKHLSKHSVIFSGLMPLLEHLGQANIPWGIVTNKYEYLTLPLLANLKLPSTPSVVVCGDTLPYAKPHPAPVEYAAAQTQVLPQHGVYIGDAMRDIVSGRLAGMTTIAVTYGYILYNEDPLTWGANHIIATPDALMDWILNWLDAPNS